MRQAQCFRLGNLALTEVLKQMLEEDIGDERDAPLPVGCPSTSKTLSIEMQRQLVE